MSFLLSFMVFLAAPVTLPASSAEAADETTILVAYYSETANTESLANALPGSHGRFGKQGSIP